MPNRIYWFAFYDLRSPSVRYRGYHILNELEGSYGAKTHFFTPSWRLLSVLRFSALTLSVHFRSRKNTRVIIQRVHSKGVYASVLKFIVRNNRSICFYDLDDAQYEECDPSTIHWFLKKVSGVFVGSEALKDYCSKHNMNVMLCTSATTNHEVRKHSRNELFTIGWIGNFWGQHEQNMFELFLPSMKLVEVPVRLEILGVVHAPVEEKLIEFFSENENIELSIPKGVDWQNESEVYKRIAEFDVGVSPLLDTEINRCKSAYKLKQYLSCGVPVLGSEIGENKRFIEHGVNGFICNSTDEFTKRIMELRDMEEQKYAQLMRSALNSERNFNISIVTDEFHALLNRTKLEIAISSDLSVSK